MTLNLLVAPDFAPENFPGWYMLSTLLQHRSGLRLHLLMPADAAEQALEAQRRGGVGRGEGGHRPGQNQTRSAHGEGFPEQSHAPSPFRA